MPRPLARAPAYSSPQPSQRTDMLISESCVSMPVGEEPQQRGVGPFVVDDEARVDPQHGTAGLPDVVGVGVAAQPVRPLRRGYSGPAGSARTRRSGLHAAADHSYSPALGKSLLHLTLVCSCWLCRNRPGESSYGQFVAAGLTDVCDFSAIRLSPMCQNEAGLRSRLTGTREGQTFDQPRSSADPCRSDQARLFRGGPPRGSATRRRRSPSRWRRWSGTPASNCSSDRPAASSPPKRPW